MEWECWECWEHGGEGVLNDFLKDDARYQDDETINLASSKLFLEIASS